MKLADLRVDPIIVEQARDALADVLPLQLGLATTRELYSISKMIHIMRVPPYVRERITLFYDRCKEAEGVVHANPIHLSDSDREELTRPGVVEVLYPVIGEGKTLYAVQKSADEPVVETDVDGIPLNPDDESLFDVDMTGVYSQELRLLLDKNRILQARVRDLNTTLDRYRSQEPMV